jgi:hypothetical protein
MTGYDGDGPRVQGLDNVPSWPCGSPRRMAAAGRWTGWLTAPGGPAAGCRPEDHVLLHLFAELSRNVDCTSISVSTPSISRDAF